MRLSNEPEPIILSPCQSVALAGFHALPARWNPEVDNGLIVGPPRFAENPQVSDERVVAIHKPSSLLRDVSTLLELLPEHRPAYLDTYYVRLRSKSGQWSHGREHWEIVEIRRARDDFRLPFVFKVDREGQLTCTEEEAKAA